MTNISIEAILEMLNQPSALFKILIHDPTTHRILTLLLQLPDLHRAGITLHLPLHSSTRTTAIPDTPSIYFISPTRENLQRVCEDLGRGVTEEAWVNVSTSMTRDMLEEMASICAQADTAHRVRAVQDQHLGFLALDQDVFSLDVPNVFSTLASPGVSDYVIEDIIERCTAGMFSVVATLDVIPVIRCRKGGIAERIARKLESRLRDHAMSSSSSQQQQTSRFQRPCLCILDRSIDPTALLHHAWSYRALVHDTLPIQLNQVKVAVEENGRKQVRDYDLGDSKDFFWPRVVSMPFPKVAEEVDRELAEYKEKAGKITRLTAMGAADEAGAGLVDQTRGLKTAMDQLPELTQRKATLDAHVNVATAVLEAVKLRSLDMFVPLEEAIATQRGNRKEVLDVIRDKGTVWDRVRLYVVWMWYMGEDAEMEGLLKEGAVAEWNDIEPVLKWAKQTRSLTRIISGVAVTGSVSVVSETGRASPAPARYGTPSNAGDDGGMYGKFSSFSARLRDGTSTLTSLVSSVKQLYPASSLIFPITKEIAALMDPTIHASTPSSLAPAGTAAVEDILTLDPKRPQRSTGGGDMGGGVARMGFSDGLVLVVGGGGWVERENVAEWAEKNKKNVAYGVTEMVSPEAFIKEWAELGRR